MALALLILGVVLLLAGWRGTYADLGDRFASDVGGFLPWIAAIIAIGAIGYVPELRAFSNALLGLVILVILLANHGVFAQWASLAQSPPAPAGDTSLIPAQDRAALSQNPRIDIGLAGSRSNSSNKIGAGPGLFGNLFSIFQTLGSGSLGG